MQVITKKVKKHVQLDKSWKSVTTGSIRNNTEASTENVKNDDIENVIETKDDTWSKIMFNVVNYSEAAENITTSEKSWGKLWNEILKINCRICVKKV